jgi:hypothetical protein
VRLRLDVRRRVSTSLCLALHPASEYNQDDKHSHPQYYDLPHYFLHRTRHLKVNTLRALIQPAPEGGLGIVVTLALAGLPELKGTMLLAFARPLPV